MADHFNFPFNPADAAADICVVGGAGHIGLPLSIVFAAKGKRVLVYDINKDALSSIARGEIPFMEENAAPLLRDALDKGLLSLSSDPTRLKGVPTIVVTIGTMVDEFLNPALKVMRNCVDDLLPFLSDGQLLVLRSTVYPGTTEWIDKYLLSHGKNIKVSFCPERIVEGFAIRELQKFPQLISGTTTLAEEEAAALFRLIAPSVVMLSPLEAEFAKLLSNAYRYIHFAIANQFYMLATSAGIDYYHLVEGMKRNYPRMSDLPDAGFTAGPCLFKDSMQMVAFSNNQFNLAHSAMLVNEGLPLFLVERLAREYDLETLTIGLLGMAFKADIDDPRSSLSYKMKKILTFRAKAVLTTDPYVKGDPDILPLEDVLDRSDLLILCTPHNVYRDLDLEGRVVVDVWNFWPERGAAQNALVRAIETAKA